MWRLSWVNHWAADSRRLVFKVLSLARAASGRILSPQEKASGFYLSSHSVWAVKTWVCVAPEITNWQQAYKPGQTMMLFISQSPSGYAKIKLSWSIRRKSICTLLLWLYSPSYILYLNIPEKCVDGLFIYLKVEILTEMSFNRRKSSQKGSSSGRLHSGTVDINANMLMSSSYEVHYQFKTSVSLSFLKTVSLNGWFTDKIYNEQPEMSSESRLFHIQPICCYSNSNATLINQRNSSP